MISPAHRYAGASALVLGASGFIGAWAARALNQAGATVYAVGRDSRRTAAVLTHRQARVHVVTADLEMPGAVSRLIDQVRPSIVFNLCGYGVDRSERDVTAMTALNARLVGELCERLADQPPDDWNGLRLVHAGSALEYGQVPGPLHESTTPNPTTDYGRTKLMGTGLIRRAGAARGLRAVVARLFTVYGAGEHPDRLLPSLQRIAREGGRLGLTAGVQRRDFTYVEDVAEGLVRLGVSDAGPGEVVNLATGRLTPVRAFAETAASLLGIDPSMLDFGALPVAGGEMFHDTVSVSRVRDLLSWVPSTEISDGIRRALEYQDAR